MPQRLKVFVSSPADVPAERLRADLICDKISQDYSRFLTLDTYRWEHEPMLASGHFQDAIEPPSRADIVLLILWSRLGTPLPEKTGAREYRGIDGRAPVTGTEWEFEEALASARARGAPDILVFRNVSPAPVDPRDPDARARSLAQLEALDAFWKRHFTDRGVFLAAFGEYHTLDEFAMRLEESMRKLIERRIQGLAAGPGVPAVPVWSAAPFRGLEPYEFEHAPIFFGRDALVAKAAEQLSAGARAGSAFLLVSGASGSGKSSLVKAALIPRLMKPQRISGAAFLRRAVFRPGDARQDVVRGLVDALVTPTAPGVGLPELVGAGQSAEDLARHLRASADEPGYPFAGALGRLTAQERATGRILGYEEAKLILLVDQLEELFTSDQIRDEDRRLFVRLLAGLARSGQVWVVTTMRADFWHRAAQVPELIALSDGLSRIEIPPPGPAELAEIIRKPAAAAGIGFETHPETRIGLDALIAEHAALGPGVLPLLSFTLDALYAEDVAKRSGRELTYRTYEELGGLEGAIATRAEAVVSELPERARAMIPRILRALTTVDWGAEQTAVARSAPLASFAPGSDARTAIDALTAARLLVATGEGGEPRVRLAHEALIGRWQRAKAQLVADRRDLETRALVERQLARWRAASGAAQRQLYLRDPDLANAVDLERRWGEELDQETRDFIGASRQRARRRQRLVAAAAAVFALVALTASVLGLVAYRSQQLADRERARAEKNYSAARNAVENLIFDLAQGVAGLRIETIENTLKAVERTIEQLLGQAASDPQLEYNRIAMFQRFADIYLDAHDLKRAGEAADRSLALALDAAARYSDPKVWQPPIWFALNLIGLVKSKLGDKSDALKAYDAGLKIGRVLIALDPANPKWKRELSVNLNRIGDEKLEAPDVKGALDAYQEGLDLMRAISAAAAEDVELRESLMVSVGRLGLVKQTAGDLKGAMEAYEEVLKFRRELAARVPGDPARQHAVAVMLERLGDAKEASGDIAGARAAFEEIIGIEKELVRIDPAQGDWQRGLGLGFRRLGGMLRKAGDVVGADKTVQDEIAVFRKLAARNVPQWQFDLWIALTQAVSLKFAVNDKTGARAILVESVQAGGKVVASNPKDTARLMDLWLQFDSLGNLEAEANNATAALRAYEEGLGLARRLLILSPADQRLEPGTAIVLYKIGETRRKLGDKDGARTALSESLSVVEKLEREGRLTDQQHDWPKVVRKAIADLDAPAR